MAKRGDIALRRFFGWALVVMDKSVRSGNTPDVAAIVAIDITIEEAEHGGIGIGAGTVRRVKRTWRQMADVLAREWAARTIAEAT